MGRTGNWQIRLEGVVLQRSKPAREAAYWLYKELSCNYWKARSSVSTTSTNPTACISAAHVVVTVHWTDRLIHSQQTPPLRFVVSTTQSRCVCIVIKNRTGPISAHGLNDYTQFKEFIVLSSSPNWHNNASSAWHEPLTYNVSTENIWYQVDVLLNWAKWHRYCSSDLSDFDKLCEEADKELSVQIPNIPPPSTSS